MHTSEEFQLGGVDTLLGCIVKLCMPKHYSMNDY